MKCKDCAYYYAEIGPDGQPLTLNFCHYRWNDGYAPCEIDEREDDREE